MAKQKTTQTEADVAAFIAGVADLARRADCLELVDMMSAATNEQPKLWGTSIVGFGTYHYRYASGREGDTCVLGFAPRKDALTLYFCNGIEAHADRLQQLGKHKTGKGCLYIRRLADIDRASLAQLLADAAAQSHE